MQETGPRTIVLLAMLSWGCGGTGDGESATITDSAGIEIVTSSGTDRELGWAFTEEWRIGGAAIGPESFSAVTPSTVAVDDGGRIYVLDSDGGLVHRFASDGRHVATVGGKGGGPGEITRASGFAVMPDGAVMVHDLGGGALVRWDADGGLLPKIPAGGDGSVFPGGATGIRARGDTLVYLTMEFAADGQQVRVMSATPRSTDTVVSTFRPGSMVNLGCVTMAMPPLFTPFVDYSLGEDGITVTTQHEYRVDVLSGGGKVRSVRRSIPASVPTLEDARKLYPDGYRPLGGELRSLCVISAEELIEKLGLAERVPVVSRARSGPHGELWVQRYSFPDTDPVVDVFDRDGGYLGSHTGLPLPLGFIGADRAVYPHTDPETGLAYLVSYRIDRGARSD